MVIINHIHMDVTNYWHLIHIIDLNVQNQFTSSWIINFYELLSS
jgi:hypothetical protein